MEISIDNLNSKTRDLLRALNRNETVKVFYQGKLISKIIPCAQPVKMHIQDHPFFGMLQDTTEDIPNQMDFLRGGYRDNL